MHYTTMTKPELIARLKDQVNYCRRLYNEKQEAEKDSRLLAEWAGKVLMAAYSLGITREQMTHEIKKIEQEENK